MCTAKFALHKQSMSTELLTWLFYGIYKRVIYIELFAYAKNIPKKKELFLKTPKERSQITVVEVKKSAYGEAL